jgi:hypothetical protein
MGETSTSVLGRSTIRLRLLIAVVTTVTFVSVLTTALVSGALTRQLAAHPVAVGLPTLLATALVAGMWVHLGYTTGLD